MTLEHEPIIQKILQIPDLAEIYCDKGKLPAPHSPENPLAIVLGADPSTRNPAQVFDVVFDLGKSKTPYFRDIEHNLKKLGLSRNCVYVQNVVQNYCLVETSKNRYWYQFAAIWLDELKTELDQNVPPNVPVFITAEKIYFALLGEKKSAKFRAETLYRERIILEPKNNKLMRRVFPLFRHYKYNLKNWNDYVRFVKQECHFDRECK